MLIEGSLYDKNDTDLLFHSLSHFVICMDMILKLAKFTVLTKERKETGKPKQFSL